MKKLIKVEVKSGEQGGTQATKVWRDPPASGLAVGIKPRAKGGGRQTFFAVAGTRPVSSRFLVFLLLIKFIQFIIINAHTV